MKHSLVYVSNRVEVACSSLILQARAISTNLYPDESWADIYGGEPVEGNFTKDEALRLAQELTTEDVVYRKAADYGSSKATGIVRGRTVDGLVVQIWCWHEESASDGDA